MKLVIFIFLISLKGNLLCLINGVVEGQCSAKLDIASQIPFCYNYITDNVCVPFVSDIWPEMTITSIDSAIETNLIAYIGTEFSNEITVLSAMPMINNIGCLESYLTLICKDNFKSCNITSDTTSPLCASVCSDFSTKCNSYSTLCGSLSIIDSSADPNCFT